MATKPTGREIKPIQDTQYMESMAQGDAVGIVSRVGISSVGTPSRYCVDGIGTPITGHQSMVGTPSSEESNQ